MNPECKYPNHPNNIKCLERHVPPLLPTIGPAEYHRDDPIPTPAVFQAKEVKYCAHDHREGNCRHKECKHYAPHSRPHTLESSCHNSYVYRKDDKAHCWHCKRVCKALVIDKCRICGAEPMTTNCNNAGCDK